MQAADFLLNISLREHSQRDSQKIKSTERIVLLKGEISPDSGYDEVSMSAAWTPSLRLPELLYTQP